MSLTSVIQSLEFRNLFWAHLKPTHSADLFLDSRVLLKVSGSMFSRFLKVCAVIRPNWPFAHGGTSHWTIWTAAIHAVHNWPQRPRSHVVSFACDSNNPYNALVIVPKTLTNLHEEICKDTASSTSATASLVPKTLTNLHEEICKENTASSTSVAASLVDNKSSMSCQSYKLTGRSCSNPVHINHQNGRKACRCQPVTTVRKPSCSQSPSSPEFRSMKSVSLAMLKAEKSWAWQTPQILWWEDSLVADSAVLRLPGILSLPGIMLPVPVQSRNEQSIEQLLRCRKNISTCAGAISMSCQSCQLMWRSRCNPVHYRSPVLKEGQACKCQPVTTVRKPLSSESTSSPEFRSMNGFS